MPEMKYAVKDSLFTYLFKQPEYTRQLYLALHPEDTDVTEADCKLVTLENVLINGMYNDVGIQIRDKILLLAEAQSTFSVNIALRMLLYLAATYKEYVEENKLDLYAGKAVAIPRPELYVVYTGSRRNVPDTLLLSELYAGPGSAEVRVKVLQDRGRGDIVDQYVRFCRIADEQRRLYDYSRKAVEETLRLCMEQNILASFLVTRQKEVHEIMVTLFDQEKVMEIHDYNVAQAAERKGHRAGLQEGQKAGRDEGREEGIQAMVSTLRELSIGREIVIQKLVDRFGLLPQAAAQKVEEYWKQ